MAERVWIAWNEQRRNIGLASALKAVLYMTDHDLPGLLRYSREFYESWKIIRRENPSQCFTMNPSILSSWWLSFLKRIYKFHLVTDLHTPNLKLSGLKRRMFLILFNSGIRHSDVVIVTNNIFKKSVESLNSHVVIVPDPLPVFNDKAEDISAAYQKSSKMTILFICSFGEDEPVEEVLALDSELDEFEILVTGNWKKRFRSCPVTRNVTFLGYLPDDEYERLLMSVDGIMVLTEEEGCLCCGAYEAFSARKPVILSRTKALQSYFGKAPVYTDHSSGSILSALRLLKVERAERVKLVEQECPVLTEKFEESIENLENVLSDLKHTEQ